MGIYTSQLPSMDIKSPLRSKYNREWDGWVVIILMAKDYLMSGGGDGGG